MTAAATVMTSNPKTSHQIFANGADICLNAKALFCCHSVFCWLPFIVKSGFACCPLEEKLLMPETADLQLLLTLTSSPGTFRFPSEFNTICFT